MTDLNELLPTSPWREVMQQEKRRFVDMVAVHQHATSIRALQFFLKRTVYEMQSDLSDELTTLEQLPGWVRFAHSRQGIE